MPHKDLPLAELEKYRPQRPEPSDFDEFWSSTLATARSFDLDARFDDIDAGLSELIVQDVTFNGFNGEPIKGWFLAPKHVAGPLPVVIRYDGYGGGRGLPAQWTAIPSAGFAYFLMDTRGQGSHSRPGSTPDLGAGPRVGGFMTLGISDPETYYYRRLFTDAVRAVEAAAAHPLVDASRIIVSGASQGGASALAAAGLTEGLLGAIIDVLFLTHIRRATEMIDTGPYHEIVRYLHTHRHQDEQVFQTLSYFDGMNFATRAIVPAMFSVGLMDETCPPSTIYAAYNHYAGEKKMIVYPYNGHEHGEAFQLVEHIRFVHERGGRG